LFRKIAEEIRAYSTPVLRIHSTGEPLLWQNLPDALDILKETGVKSWLFTSAVTTDTSLLDAICEAVSIIEVSVNSISAENYLSTKGIDAFTLVTENIRYMRGAIGQEKSRRLIVSRVESDQVDVDNRFIRYWQSSNLVDDAFIRSRHTYNNLLPELAPVLTPAAKKRPCLVHWARFNIGLDGRAIICFNELFKKDIDPALVLGNMNTELIAEIWKGAKLTALRRAELTRDYSKLTYENMLPCKNCTHYQPLFGAERKTSEYQLRQIG
jgi:MoaA/NifB/PqqE/SkfB family radical SAM enzyme